MDYEGIAICLSIAAALGFLVWYLTKNAEEPWDGWDDDDSEPDTEAIEAEPLSNEEVAQYVEQLLRMDKERNAKMLRDAAQHAKIVRKVSTVNPAVEAGLRKREGAANGDALRRIREMDEVRGTLYGARANIPLSVPVWMPVETEVIIDKSTAFNGPTVPDSTYYPAPGMDCAEAHDPQAESGFTPNVGDYPGSNGATGLDSSSSTSDSNE